MVSTALYHERLSRAVAIRTLLLLQEMTHTLLILSVVFPKAVIFSCLHHKITTCSCPNEDIDTKALSPNSMSESCKVD